MDSLTYTPPGDGAPVTFAESGPFSLEGLDGALANAAGVLSATSPGQVGVTVTQIRVEARQLVAQVLVLGESRAHVLELRATLARALAMVPAEHDEAPSLGVLRLEREGLPDLELDAVPVNSPTDTAWTGPTSLMVDVEFECPHPHWREVESRLFPMVTNGGFEFPLEHDAEDGLVLLTMNVGADIENPGDVPAPIVARLHGDMTNVRLVNETTGKSLAFTLRINEGEHLEVVTAFGRKSATLHRADGTTDNALRYLDLDGSSFWQLAPGVNVVRMEADTNVTGSGELEYLPRYAGA